MSNFKIKLYKYKLEYKKPIYMKGQWQSHRMGLILATEFEVPSSDIDIDVHSGIITSYSKTIYTEFSPFPGLHEESLEQITKQKDKIIDYVSKIISNQLVDINIFPNSIKIGLEFFQNELLKYRVEDEKINENLIDIAPLLHGTREEVLEKVEQINKIENIKSIKLKLGRDSLANDIDLFNLVDFHLNKDVKIRADVNRAWDMDQAMLFSTKIIKDRVEYLEEPFNLPQKFDEFYLTTNIKYCLDESVYEGLDLNKFEHKHALIIKPNLLDTLDLLEEYKYQNYRMIFSSAFESGILISKYLGLIEKYADSNDPQGLDTYSSFNNDVLKKRLLINNYQISLSEINQINNYLNHDVLEEIG